MFRTKDSEQFLQRNRSNRSEPSLSNEQLIEAARSSDMVQRDTGSNWPYAVAPATEAATAEANLPSAFGKPVNKLRAVLQRVYERLSESDWERQRREREEYLAQSVDLYDLEARMRSYDRFVARGIYY